MDVNAALPEVLEAALIHHGIHEAAKALDKRRAQWLILGILEGMSIKVYYASVSGSLEIKKWQTHICSVLESKKISFTLVDICQSQDVKQEMRDRARDPAALPPQICNGDVYCGDYAAFDGAVEDEALEAFLKL